MEIKSRWSFFTQLVIMLLIVQGCFADCSSPSNSLNREITIDSWTENWTFEGVEVGTYSNDYYYLLSSADDNQCGIIRENLSGQVVWARTYTNGQCSGLTLSVDKTRLYFSSAYTGYYGLGKVRTVDGNLSNYFAASELTLTGKVTSIRSIYEFGEEYIEAFGNFTSTSCLNLRIWFKPFFDDLRYIGSPNCTDSTTTNDLILLLDNNVWNSRFIFNVYLNNITQIQLRMVDLSLCDANADWAKTITCTSTCPAADYTRSDFDGTNVHFAANFPSDGKVLIMVLAVSNGDLVGTMKMTQNSQQMTLGSLLIGNDSITWISAYSTSSAYSELIRLDSANNNYTVYQQTGISYVFQHIDSSNNNWFGVGLTKFISNSTQACISDIAGLSVSVSQSGLDEALSFSLASIDLFNITTVIYSLTINTSITNTASDMGYALVAIEHANEDDLSNGQIVNIVISSLFGLVCIISIAVCMIFIIRKRRNRYDGRQEVSVEVQREDHHYEQDHESHHQDDDSQHYGDDDSQHFEIEDDKNDQDDVEDNQV